MQCFYTAVALMLAMAALQGLCPVRALDCSTVRCAAPDCANPKPPTSRQCCSRCPGNSDDGDCPPGKPEVNCLINPCDVATCPAFPDAVCVADYCGGCNAKFFIGQREVTKRCEQGEQSQRKRQTLVDCSAVLCAAPDCANPMLVPGQCCPKCSGNSDHGNCPPSKPEVNCLADPCDFATCPAFPDAECVADYCGGCNAKFFISHKEVTKKCEQSQKKRRTPVDCSAVKCAAPDCANPMLVPGQCCPQCSGNSDHGNCPPSQPVFNCLVDPCDVATCPAFPDAVCAADYCGGCNARFYIGHKEVTKKCELGEQSQKKRASQTITLNQRKSGGSCPPGNPEVNCFTDPCDFATCPAFPDAECVADYCGGCNTRFYKNGKEVTKRCEQGGKNKRRRRRQDDTCEIEGQVFLTCGTGCPPTCAEPGPAFCTEQCVQGCQCPSGTLLDEKAGKCVNDLADCTNTLPDCSKDFCTAAGNEHALCNIPGPREIPGCFGQYTLTFCSACYYSEETRPLPSGCRDCGSPVDISDRQVLSCFKRWAKCVHRKDIKKYGEPESNCITQDKFKCYRYPCQLRG